VLVQADRQDPRIVPERGLDAVPVMYVDVDVRDPLGALAEQPRDGDGGIVVDAEAAGIRPHRVMQAARDVRAVPDRARPHGPGRRQRRARDERGCLMHVREDRIVAGAESGLQQSRDVGRAVAVVRREPAGVPYCLDIGRVVHELKLGVGSWRRAGDGDRLAGEDAERSRQFHRQLHPDRRQRMLRPEVVRD
jgi:hypothetical protein